MTAELSCALCSFKSDDSVVFEDSMWIVRSISRQPAIAGWLIIQSRRHIADVSELNADEASSVGSLLRNIAQLLRSASGALHIYTGSLNEGTPHFHTQVLPRLAEMPNNAIGWNAFALSAAAQRGDVRADPAEVERVVSAVRAGAAAFSRMG